MRRMLHQTGIPSPGVEKGEYQSITKRRCHRADTVSVVLSFQLLVVVATTLAFCDGFAFQQQFPQQQQQHWRTTAAHSSTTLFSSSTSSSAPTFNTLSEFNQHLQILSEKSAVTKEPVIIRAAECEEIWEKQCHPQDNDEAATKFQPNTQSFNTVLEAWNRCVQTLVKYENEGDSAVAPDILKLGSKATKSLPPGAVDIYTPFDAAKHATALLLDHPDRDTDSYNLVLDCWANSKVHDAPEYAERVFRTMMNDENAQLDASTYNILIGCWAESGRGVEKAVQIYRHMEKKNKDGSNSQNVPAPTIRTVNSVLHAHSKQAARCIAENYRSRNGYNEALQLAQEADEIFKEAKERYEQSGQNEWSPDATTYTTLIDCYSRCGKARTAQRSEQLLDELKALYKETKEFRYKVNFKTFTAVITAWARARAPIAPERVQALLTEMKKSEETYPNARSYTAAIQCWSRSNDPHKAKNALNILMDMRNEFNENGRKSVRPTTITYDTAIECCSKSTEGQTEALKIAFAILKTMEMDSNTSPTNVTFRNLLSTISLLPQGAERNKLASSVFKKAKAAGLADFDVIRKLRTTVDTDTMRDCLEGKLDPSGHFNFDDLPRSWSKNT
mmetsp:Transcript_25755/g.61012  ORF Transcript_25755/g.61012 Transcript_25755/m.61012 type:complete len:616 (-) Transcript_25755:152-1999(-)